MTVIFIYEGTALVIQKLSEKSLLWTDGRYFLQASQQLSSSEWILMKSGQPDVLELNDWLIANFPDGIIYVIDYKLSISNFFYFMSCDYILEICY